MAALGTTTQTFRTDSIVARDENPPGIFRAGRATRSLFCLHCCSKTSSLASDESSDVLSNLRGISRLKIPGDPIHLLPPT